MDKVEPSQIAALVRLLGDENPRVSGPVRKELERVGTAAVDQLHEAAVHAEDARLRIRARKFLSDMRRQEVLDEWTGQSVAIDEGLDIETGAIQISRLEYPNETAQSAIETLDGYADVLRRRIVTLRSVDAAVDALILLLSGELGFGGGDLDYEDPDNSFIHRVLEKKTGLPILIAAIYLCVARRVGLPIEGVGMPQHFILKYTGRDGRDVFFDPFNAGQKMTVDDCRRFLARSGITFHSAYLAASSDREILSRMLGNLLRAYQSGGDSARLGKILVLLRMIESGE